MTQAEVTAIAIKWSNSKFVAMSDRFVQDFAREILAAAKVAQPDCRTCKYGDTPDELNDYKWGCLCAARVCTNGDKYQPAPKVVLWRTE